MPWLGRKPDPYRTPMHCVYKYVFENYHAVYVGLTIEPERRDRHHRDGSNGSSVYRFASSHGVSVPSMQLVASGLRVDEAQAIEDETIKLCREDGWQILNKARTGIGVGSIGCSAHRWTKPRVFEVASGFTRRKHFERTYPSAYDVARRNGWLDELIPLPPQIPKPPSKPKVLMLTYKPSYDDLLAEAKKYHSRKEFMQKSWGGLYEKARKAGIVDMLFPNKRTPREIMSFDTNGNVATWPNAYAAAKALRVCRINIVQICKGQFHKQYIHGYTFRYA